MVSQLVRYGINAAIIAFVWQVRESYCVYSVDSVRSNLSVVHPDGPDLPVMTIFWEGLFLANLALAVTFRAGMAGRSLCGASQGYKIMPIPPIVREVILSERHGRHESREIQHISWVCISELFLN
ncbi:uncharacterized protein FFB20_14063 [Fusarium fujikuroi]|nr:uncharacterized protein FFC1_01888 [Fusarium fujikuroi]SCO08142.1 uncharacterized protein FFE2_11463 [Fusarium fujikuroi]SCO12074.1 uncharacterized protein FFM5_10190 [Fusarium fujikuroi]SCO12760.1 uncharacterized protein FFB20_14063 [Fusarium fujikuroi]SCO27460.1 uncharacterized protein FFMR_00340 [Fusarium fujikuroi]